MTKQKIKKTIKKSLPKSTLVWFSATLVGIIICTLIYYSLATGIGSLASIYAPTGINVIGTSGTNSIGKSLSASTLTKTGSGSTVTKNTNGTTTTVTASSHTEKDETIDGKGNNTVSTVVKTTTTDKNNNIVSTTNNIIDRTVNSKSETVGNVSIVKRTIDFKPGIKNPSNGDVSKINNSTNVTKTTITADTVDPKTNTVISTETKSFAPTETPILKSSAITSTSSTSTSSDKVNCDAGMCGTNGSPVCSGAYVFTGGNATSSNVSDGSYGCVQCQGGSLSHDVKDCNKLIAEGKPVVLPYDANNKWLSSIKVDKMTSPCFINRGGTWVQAAYGQSGEGESTGKVCDGNGKWVDPPKTTTPVVAQTPPVTPTTPTTHVVVKKTVCNGGTLAGLAIDTVKVGTAIISGPAGIPASGVDAIMGAIDGVKTVINCVNSQDPSFSFCHTKSGFDANGNCIPDAVDPTIVVDPTNPAGLPTTPIQFVQDHPGRAAISAGAGGLTGALAGFSTCAVTGIGITISPICALVGAGVGAYTGNSVGNTLSNVQELINDPALPQTPIQFFQDHPGRAAISSTAGALTGGAIAASTCVVTVILAPISPLCGIAGAITGGYVGNYVGNGVSNMQDLTNDSSLPQTPIQFFQDHPGRAAISSGAGFLTGCASGSAVGSIIPVGGNITGCIIGGITGALLGNSVGNTISNGQDVINGSVNPSDLNKSDNSTTPTSPNAEKSKDDSLIIAPSTLAQGGSGLNTGPVNQITPASNTAGQTGGNSFTHFNQQDYGNGIDKNGCYLTAAAMIIANYGTVDKGLNPEQLNDKYLNGAFVGGGDVSILSNADKANGITITDVSRQSDVKSNPTAYVANNSSTTTPIAVAIYCNNCADNGHWVIAVGKDSNGSPLVWDPLKNGQTSPQPLNSSTYPGLDLTNHGQSVDVRQVITSSP